MANNAFVCWDVTNEPWVVEERLIQTVSLPLNVQGNAHHAFCSTLRSLRAEARASARSAPIGASGGGRRGYRSQTARFQIHDGTFGHDLHEAANAREALLEFVANIAKGEARFLIQDEVDDGASIVWNGRRYHTVRVDGTR